MNESYVERHLGAESRYLVFTVGADRYASELLAVREVIEYQCPRKVPNMSEYYLGVINVRGTLYGVVDLAVKLGLGQTKGKRRAMLLTETSGGAIAFIVQEVNEVTRFESQDIESAAEFVEVKDLEFVTGVARKSGELTLLVDLGKFEIR